MLGLERTLGVLAVVLLSSCGGEGDVSPRGGGAAGGFGSGGAGGDSQGNGGSGGPNGGADGGGAVGGSPGERAMFVADDDGYVIMEMESVAIPAGHEWRQESSLSDFTGSGYYRFTGNGICNGPATSSLRYEFQVKRAARYELRLRAAKIAHCVEGAPQGNGTCTEHDRTCTSLGEPTDGACGGTNQCVRTDISNDAFVHIEDGSGRYVAFVDQPSDSIGDPIKLFGGQPNAWAWTGKRALDIHGKWDAHWDLPEGRHTLVVQGRSQAFRIDRILLFDAETGSTSGAADRPETR